MERAMQLNTGHGRWFAAIVVAIGTVLFASAVLAQEEGPSRDGTVIFGVKVRAGGRFDNVRMCVASPAGAKGGPAMDVSLFAEVGVADEIAIEVDVPFVRPLLFAAAFRMLQFEPSVALKFYRDTSGSMDLVAGPVVGVSLHYGPDYESERKGDGRRPSFFAIGPTVGGYFGLDFARPGETFNFELGLTPYITPLFGVGDPDGHRGLVIGGLIDGSFRFDTGAS
jgi:hypothetical protein